MSDIQVWLLLHKVTLRLLYELDWGPSMDKALRDLLDAIPDPTDEPTAIMREPIIAAAKELLELASLGDRYELLE